MNPKNISVIADIFILWPLNASLLLNTKTNRNKKAGGNETLLYMQETSLRHNPE